MQSFWQPPIPATSPMGKIEAPKGAELGAAVGKKCELTGLQARSLCAESACCDFRTLEAGSSKFGSPALQSSEAQPESRSESGDRQKTLCTHLVPGDAPPGISCLINH